MATEPTPASELDHRLRDLAPGWHFAGRYRMEGLVGRGGMGVVWRAQDETLERPVALKFLVETLVHDPMAIDDLKRETRRALELTHHNIVRVYDFVEDQAQGLAGIAMEFFPGKTAAAIRIAQPTRCFAPDIIAPWIAQLCDAMAYAHEKVGVIHRDLKPQNLMIDDRGELKITDFGIARVASDSLTRISIGKVSGTPCYMSPQQARGEAPTATDDIYAIGATLYELLTSRPPFWQGNIGIQLAEFIPPPLAERRRDLTGIEVEVPAHWETTIAACLAKNAQDRPRSARELADRLGIALPSTHFHLSAITRSISAPRPVPAPSEATLSVNVDDEHDMPTLVGVPLVLPAKSPTVAAPPPLPAKGIATTSSSLPPPIPVVAPPPLTSAPPAPPLPPASTVPTRSRGFPTWIWFATAAVLLILLAFLGGAAVRHWVGGSDAVPNPVIDPGQSPRGARTIHVPDEYPTIQAAIDESHPGDSIVLRAGTYRESITLRDGVRLAGESADTCKLVQPPGATAVIFARGVRGCSIENLSIEASGMNDAAVWSAGWVLKNDPAGVLVESVKPGSPAARAGIGQGVRVRKLDGQTVEQAEEVPYLLAHGNAAREVQAEVETKGIRQVVKITTDRIAGTGNWPDGIVISNSEVNVTGCMVKGAGGVGIVLLGEHTTGEFSRNQVLDSETNGIVLVNTKSGVTLRGNQVRGNKGIGISFDHAGALAIENIVEHNGTFGIFVSSSDSAPTLRANQCRDHENSGIAFADGAAGVAEANICERNGDSGILVAGASSAPTLRENRCLANVKDGIVFTQNARGLAENNTCTGNGGSGIAAGGHAAPTLQGNTCKTNTFHGISFAGAARGTAAGNTTEENADSGLAAFGEGTAPEFSRNTSRRNAHYGIYFGNGADGQAAGNLCEENRYSGIRTTSVSTRPVISGNRLVRNQQYGIEVTEGASPRLAADNEFTGNAAGTVLR